MAMTNVDIDNFRESFDRTDKDKVREHLTMNRYNAEQAALAYQWLNDLEEERATRDREEELGISREANRIAHNANHWSMVATAIALLALIVAALAYGRP